MLGLNVYEIIISLLIWALLTQFHYYTCKQDKEPQSLVKCALDAMWPAAFVALLLFIYEHNDNCDMISAFDGLC